MAKTAHLILFSRYLNRFNRHSVCKFIPPGSTLSFPGGFSILVALILLFYRFNGG